MLGTCPMAEGWPATKNRRGVVFWGAYSKTQDTEKEHQRKKSSGKKEGLRESKEAAQGLKLQKRFASFRN